MMNGEKSLVFPIEGGMYHTEEILRQMAMAQARCGVSFTSLLNKDVKQFVSGAELFILTPYVDETMDEYISALKRNNNSQNFPTRTDFTLGSNLARVAEANGGCVVIKVKSL